MSSTTERSLVLIKPDAVRRGLVGAVLSRLETKGLTIAARDIFPGEEITSDYQAFDADFEQYRHLMKEVELIPVSSNGSTTAGRPKS